MNIKKITALLCAVVMVLSLAACGSNGDKAENKHYTVGICQLVQHDALDAATKGFRDAITDALGAENVTFDEQNAAGDSATCATICNGFVSSGVDLILANATGALQAAAAATKDIPILGTAVTEYGVALGIDNFSGTVGGNISGTSDLAPLDQQAAMITELFPDAKNVGIIYCSGEPNSVYQVEVVKAALEKAGCTADMSSTDICEALIQAMPTLSVDGLTGKAMTWNAEGEVSKAPLAAVIENGEYVMK